MTYYHKLAVEAQKRLDKLHDPLIHVTPARKNQRSLTRAYEVLIEERKEEEKP